MIFTTFSCIFVIRTLSYHCESVVISEVIMTICVGLDLLFYGTDTRRIIALKRTSLIDKRYVVKGLIWFNGIAPFSLQGEPRFEFSSTATSSINKILREIHKFFKRQNSTKNKKT